MKLFSYVGKKSEQLYTSCRCRFAWFHQNKLLLELLYFLLISSLGFVILRSLDGRTSTSTPRNLDLFFTSVSATTGSSISTVEMEVFSNTQLVVLTILMFIGGEVFCSMSVHYIRMFFVNVFPSTCYQDTQSGSLDKIELKDIKILEFGSSKSNNFCSGTISSSESNTEDLKYKSFKFLGVVVSFYLVFIHFLGVVSVLIYLHVVPSVDNTLKHKGLQSLTFSIFTVVSTFANCGFVPTNENMLIFSKNSGLLLILIPQALLGNTLYPPVLRFFILAIGKFVKKSETRYLLENSKKIGYDHHLLSNRRSFLLLITVVAFIMVQFVLFSTTEWSSESLEGLNVYQKLVAILFQTVNTRHAGESIVDLSTINGAMLVMFVLMMYLPPYTSFLTTIEECSEQGRKRSQKFFENFIFSQQTYLVIFIILICIIEKKQMADDPLNFNVLNIVFEVTSAYGNVGFSIGYSCDRRLKQDGVCHNKWYGFSGKWSDQGKLVLIAVMIFGRLKKFNMNGGKAWKVL